MTTRTSHSLVTFAHPFALPGVDGVQPAGSYAVDTDEEMIDSLIVVAWRRTATTIHIPIHGAMELCAIDPGDLAASLARDVAGPVAPPKFGALV